MLSETGKRVADAWLEQAPPAEAVCALEAPPAVVAPRAPEPTTRERRPAPAAVTQAPAKSHVAAFVAAAVAVALLTAGALWWLGRPVAEAASAPAAKVVTANRPVVAAPDDALPALPAAKPEPVKQAAPARTKTFDPFGDRL